MVDVYHIYQLSPSKFQVYNIYQFSPSKFQVYQDTDSHGPNLRTGHVGTRALTLKQPLSRCFRDTNY